MVGKLAKLLSKELLPPLGICLGVFKPGSPSDTSDRVLIPSSQVAVGSSVCSANVKFLS